jgi:L-methionine (R)-S-oxide reductase
MVAGEEVLVNVRSKTLAYSELARQLRELLAGERDAAANMANFAALVFHELPNLNWAGFYRLVGDELVLGPFQGKPACIRIGLGQGVCGSAAVRRQTVVVPDVHQFPGHIACDSASNSEIVVPLLGPPTARLIGVLDLDSPSLGRFDADDQCGLEQLVAILLATSDV